MTFEVSKFHIELLAEIQLNFVQPQPFHARCLCSRVFLRKISNTSEIPDDFLEESEFKKNNVTRISSKSNSDGSCSGTINDDQLFLIHAFLDKNEDVLDYSFSHNSNILTESTNQKQNFLNFENYFSFCKWEDPNFCIAWEKFWDENEINIIWGSWFQKFGAYVNPNYFEENSCLKSETWNLNDLKTIKEIFSRRHNKISNCETISAPTEANDVSQINAQNHIQAYNLYSEGKLDQNNPHNCEFDKEYKFLSNNFVENNSTLREINYVNTNIDSTTSHFGKGFNLDLEDDLSTKTFALTLNSEGDAARNTLFPQHMKSESKSNINCSNASNRSDGSSGESVEKTKEADLWWNKTWDEHYEEQYKFFYAMFIQHYYKNSFNKLETLNMKYKKKYNKVCGKSKRIVESETEKLASDEDFVMSENVTESKKKEKKIKKNLVDCEDIAESMAKKKKKSKEGLVNCEDVAENRAKKKIFNRPEYINSMSYCLEWLENDKPEEKIYYNVDDNCSPPKDELVNSIIQKNVNSDSLKEEESVSDDEELVTSVKQDFKGKKNKKRVCNTLEMEKAIDNNSSVKKAMSLIGLLFEENFCAVQSGKVMYKKRNISKKNKTLKLFEANPKNHVFFDDDGSPISSEFNFNVNRDSPDTLEHLNNKEPNTEDGTSVESDLKIKINFTPENNCNIFEDDEKMAVITEKCKRDIPVEIKQNRTLLKYWHKRYRLFSKFDCGIKMDAESWFSVTPEEMAKHHAERCRSDLIIDAFCGAGGNTIQFAFTCERVIAIDIDPEKIKLAKHNAKIYGVEDRIEFIIGDFTKLADGLLGDVVFYSPPWGGVGYKNLKVYNLDTIMPPLGGEGLFHLASKITKNICFFLPKNTNVYEITALSGPEGEVEIEQNFLERRLLAITAYFGELMIYPEN